MELRWPHIIRLYHVFLENDGKENCAKVLEEECIRMLGTKYLDDEHDCNVRKRGLGFILSLVQVLSTIINIDRSYNCPSKCDEEITPKFQSSGEHKTELFVRYETTTKLFFPINLS